MRIDHLQLHEMLPAGALMLPAPDPRWVWVARDDFGIIIAYLVAVHGHGIVMPIRLHKLDEAPPTCIHLLMRHAIRECRSRGYEIYLTWIGDDTIQQCELTQMCTKRGAKEVPMKGAIISGKLASWST
jgi:hypothetical protein